MVSVCNLYSSDTSTNQSTRIALMGKVYECNVTGETFRGYDKTVLDNSPYQVRLLWKQVGCTLSHRGGIANSLIDRLRSEFNHGMSVSGFQRTILESMKKSWLLSSAHWFAYASSIRANPDSRMLMASTEEKDALKREYPDFSSSLLIFCEDVRLVLWICGIQLHLFR